MRKTILSLSLSLLAIFAAPAIAKVAPTSAIPSTTEATTVAKHGADDAPGDDRGNDGKGHRVAKHGADDAPGDDRGNDGKGHRVA